MKGFVMALIRVYQHYISPLFPSTCRFTPTCSNYMLEAIDKFGAGRGLLMGGARILRCQPLCRSGYDPVPDHFTLKSNLKEVGGPSDGTR